MMNVVLIPVPVNPTQVCSQTVTGNTLRNEQLWAEILPCPGRRMMMFQPNFAATNIHIKLLVY
jgi:hypothetical protein